MFSRCLVASAFVCCTVLGIASAQAPTGAPQREAMKKLAHWVGTWKGSGYVQYGPNAPKMETTITETIQSKLNGTTLLVEGLGKSKQGDREIVTHNALAVVSFDDKTKSYRFRHYTMQGRAGETELKFNDGGFTWELKEEGNPMIIRFTTRLDEKKWHEIGEMTRDGKTWVKFLEMNLEKQP